MGEDNGAILLGDDNSSTDASAIPEGGSNGGADQNEDGQGGNAGQFAGLSGDNLDFASKKGWKSPDELVGSYRELETKLLSASIEPKLQEGEELSDNQWSEYARRNGRPESADNYELSKPEDMPEDIYYDDALANAFKPAAHEAGLNNLQASKLHQSMSSYFIEQQQAALDARNERANQASKDLVTEYGDPSGANFKEATKGAFQSIKNSGLIDAYIQSGLMEKQPNGQYKVMDASIILAHANIAQSMLSEADPLDDMEGLSENNPFNEKTENLTHQTRLIKERPDLAKALIRQAGKDVKTFFPMG